MSIFRCLQCDTYRDADEEDNTAQTADGMGLICSRCVEADEADFEDLIYAHAQEGASL